MRPNLDINTDTWFLMYSDPDAVSIFLYIPPDSTASLTYTDLGTEIPTRVEIDEERTGGHRHELAPVS